MASKSGWAIMKFGHYYNSMETCHDSDSIIISLEVV